MAKVVVNPGRKVRDKANQRDAYAGEVIEVRDVEAKILKHRGYVSDAPAETPRAVAPAPEPEPPPPPPPPDPARTYVARDMQADEPGPAREAMSTTPRRAYRRRDMQAEET